MKLIITSVIYTAIVFIIYKRYPILYDRFSKYGNLMKALWIILLSVFCYLLAIVLTF